MLIVPPNPSQVVLQATIRNGVVLSATVRVTHIVSGSEVSVLSTANLVQVGSTNVWRYIWTPSSLVADAYIALYTITSTSGQVLTVLENIYVD